MVVEGFTFYPHKCTIFRGEQINPSTGVATPVAIIRDLDCYCEQGYAHYLGERIQGTTNIHIPDTDIKILPGDTINVTLENGTHYIAKIKQAYPVEDDEIGGQELKLYETDATE